MDKEDLIKKPNRKGDRGTADEKHVSPLVVAAIAVTLDAHFSDEGSLCSEDFAVIS